MDERAFLTFSVLILLDLSKALTIVNSENVEHMCILLLPVSGHGNKCMSCTII